MYLPKSKYSVKTVGPGEYTLGGEKYVGPVLTTYLNETYAGDSPSNLKGLVVKVEKDGEMQATHSVAGKRVPTDAEYEQGYMDRYFKQDLRTWKVVELLPEAYSASIDENKIYEKVDKVGWYLTGKFASNMNYDHMLAAEKVFPGISSSGVLCNPEQWVKIIRKRS